MLVYVVTYPELGWDCVVGVFDAEEVSKTELEKQFPESDYVISESQVQLSIED